MNPASLMSEQALAVQAERTDTRNWMDDFAAAPPHVTTALGLVTQWQRDLAMVRSL
jgi:hypothetical protein